MRAFILAAAGALAVTGACQAGTLQGADDGAAAGGAIAGPVGAIVGGAVGAAAGTVGGILGVDDRPRFRTYVEHENVRSYRYDGDVRVCAELPEAEVTYYDVPRSIMFGPAIATPSSTTNQ